MNSTNNTNKKTIFIIIGLVVLVLGVIIIIALAKTPSKTPNVNNTPATQTHSINESTTNGDKRPAPTAADNPALAEVVDIEKIDVNKTLTPEEVNLVEYEFIDAPKTVADVELMSEEEKIKMNIDPNLVVQVLGRLPNGQVTSYRFIENEGDLLIDTR